MALGDSASLFWWDMFCCYVQQHLIIIKKEEIGGDWYNHNLWIIVAIFLSSFGYFFKNTQRFNDSTYPTCFLHKYVLFTCDDTVR